MRHGEGIYYYQDRSRVEGEWAGGFLDASGQKHPHKESAVLDFKKLS